MYDVKNYEFIKDYEALCYKHDKLIVFSDFVKMCAISMYNSFAQDQNLEKEYIKAITTYSKEEQELFTKMFGKLILLYEECKEITDILGNVYMAIKPKNKNLGQVFTPEHIAELMAEMTIEDEIQFRKEIEENGFITVDDPTCGAGRSIAFICKGIAKT